MEEYNLNFKNVELIIIGEYEKGEPQEYEYPGSPSTFLIESIKVENQDIYNLISSDNEEDIKNRILEIIEN